MASIKDLPLELLHDILGLSPDPGTLHALSLTCRATYYAFKGREEQVIDTVMARYIPPGSHHDALIALKSVRLPYWPQDEYLHFEEHEFAPPTPAKVQWSLRDAVQVMIVARHVIYWADTLSRALLQQKPFVKPRPVEAENEAEAVAGAATAASRDWSPEPTAQELERWCRALFRYETFVKLMRRQKHWETLKNRMPVMPWAWDQNWVKFSSCELEQLACLNDLFMLRIADGFNQIARHDIEWGYWRIQLIASEDNKYGQHILGAGLGVLHALDVADSYEKRRAILHNGRAPKSEPFLHAMLQEAKEQEVDTETYIDGFRGMPLERRLEEIRPPFYPDPDDGPERVWTKLHLMMSRSIGMLAVHQFRHYRRWGYVFWDERRLEEVGIFDQGFDAEAAAPPDGFYPYWRIGEKGMERSRERRRKLYIRGGRGYWDKRDERRVEYPHGRK